MRRVCNPGYGRGRCDRFPADAESDAVRFHVVEDRGKTIRIQFVFERFCWPLRHASFEYSLLSREFLGMPPDAVLEAQAAAFIDSYLRRRGAL